MFSNFAWSEMLVIACVAIIVVGPKDLPAMLRSLGKTIGSVKRMAGDFQRQFNDAIKEADLDDLKDMTSTKGFGPLDDAKKTMEEFAQSMENSVDTPIDDELEAPAAAPTAKPAAKKPTAKKPVAKKPAAKKAAAAKSTNAAKSSPVKSSVKQKSAPRKKAAAKSTTATKSTS